MTPAERIAQLSARCGVAIPPAPATLPALVVTPDDKHPVGTPTGKIATGSNRRLPMSWRQLSDSWGSDHEDERIKRHRLMWLELRLAAGVIARCWNFILRHGLAICAGLGAAVFAWEGFPKLAIMAAMIATINYMLKS